LVLTANVLTVTFGFAKIHQKALKGEEDAHLTYLWLIVLVFLFVLYGFSAWRRTNFEC